MTKRLLVAFLAVLIASPPCPASAEPVPSVVFVVDVSGSMKGAKIQAAQEALKGLSKNLPANIPVGLVSFASSANVLLAPTIDRTQLVIAVDALSPSGRTALFDAIALAGNGSLDRRYVVVITDGEDTASKTSAASLALLVSKNVQVSVIGVDFDTFKNLKSELSGFVRGTSGVLISIEDTGLLAEALRKSLQNSGIELPGQEDLKLELINRPISTSTSLLVILLSLGLGLSLLLVPLSIATGIRRARTTRDRRELFSEYAFSEVQVERDSSSSLERLLGRANPKLSTSLEEAGLDFTLSRWRLTRVFVFVPPFLFLTLIRMPLWLNVAVSTVTALYLPHRYLLGKAQRRRDAFEAELPNFLAVTAGALRSGLPLSQAIDAAAREAKSELGFQMNRVVREISLGATVESALKEVSSRMRSQAFASLASAVEIQRKAGGNLSDILDRTAETVRARLELRQEVKSLAAEGLLSAKVLTALPVGMFLFLIVTRREFVAVLWQSGGGLLVLGIAISLILVGYQWISRLSKIEH